MAENELHNSLMLVQRNVERVEKEMKLGVIIGKNGRGLGVVWTQLSKKNLRLITLLLVTPSIEDQIFRNRTYKKCRAKNNVSTFEACESIRQAAENLGDENMLRVLLSVNSDLTTAEAKYHKTCLVPYISKSNLKHRVLSETNENVSDAAFKELAPEINEGIIQRRTYDMSSLLTAYRERLKAKEIAADNFGTKQRLKC